MNIYTQGVVLQIDMFLLGTYVYKRLIETFPSRQKTAQME